MIPFEPSAVQLPLPVSLPEVNGQKVLDFFAQSDTDEREEEPKPAPARPPADE